MSCGSCGGGRKYRATSSPRVAASRQGKVRWVHWSDVRERHSMSDPGVRYPDRESAEAALEASGYGHVQHVDMATGRVLEE